MRILDLNNSYSPDGGGIRVYLEEKLAYYRRRGDHAYALMLPGRRRATRRDGATTVYELPATPVPGTASRFVLRPSLIAGCIEDFRPDVIEVGSFEVLPLFVRRIVSRRPAATVGFFHQDYPESYVRAPAARLSRRLGTALGRLAERHAAWLYNGFTATFAASEFAVRRLRELGVRRVLKTPLGVDTATFRPEARDGTLRAGLGADGGRRVVLFAGRIAAEKGIDLLAAAYPGFADPKRVVLAIAGHGPDEGRLAPFLAAHPEVRRLPFVSGRQEMARLLASADLVLSLAGRETFSLTTLEAMACGAPVLAVDSGGAAELAAAAGIVVPCAARPEALAAAVRAALDARTPENETRMRSFVLGRYNWPTALDRITDCYQRVRTTFAAGDVAGLEEGQAC